MVTAMKLACDVRSWVFQGLPVLGRAGLAAFFLVTACRKPVVEAPPAAPIPEPPAATPPPATPAPPAPKPRVVEATPAPNFLAPPGVFFLLAQTSIETASGITGVRPGTQLQQTGPNEYTASEGHKLTLRPDQVTNDLRIAQQVAGADVAAQNALRQLHARRTAPAAPVAAPAATPAQAPATTASAPKPATPASMLSGSGALGASHSRIKDGYVWEKDRNGIWVRLRPVR